MSTNFQEILSRAYGNSEEQNKVLDSSKIITNYCIVLIRACYNYNYIINAQYNYYTSNKVRFAGCCSILQTGHITLSSTPDQQLENHSTKYHRQQQLYNNLELLMMGIVVTETC